MTMETPPPRGVGTECELRALGISIRLLASAYLRSNAVRIRDTSAMTITDSHSIMLVVFQIIPSGVLHGVFNTHRWMPIEHRTGFTDIDLQRAAEPL
ncbi:Formate hydrogenlyase subunit 3/Multi-subunit Na+/H+ antiporter [Pseudomonas syringae pv. actinidiae]|uniref:Formate hydrogenlyase subunit 3/Multi-subunit Na+/H+ antiporter n=1 Tax=Pseudomonas syringae pv. actinidiae TaxID=103796 RepID=A0A2V0QRS6_PSESF|nr:Formate hydrogenlyase subunit 3/Multi-subunit Na+/H+ antiporter [Pseudomonas syringae pv. actinidiae]